jgi:hypothetical protein
MYNSYINKQPLVQQFFALQQKTQKNNWISNENSKKIKYARFFLTQKRIDGTGANYYADNKRIPAFLVLSFWSHDNAKTFFIEVFVKLSYSFLIS